MWSHLHPLLLLFILCFTYPTIGTHVITKMLAFMYFSQQCAKIVLCTKIFGRSGWEYEGAYMYTEPVFVNLERSPGIDSQPGGPERQSHLSYRPARIHRLAESIPRNQFMSSLNVFKYGLCNSGTFSKSHQCRGTFSIQKMSAWFSRHTLRYRGERKKDTGR